MKSGDENALAKCKFFRKMQVTSCKICGRSDGRCRWKKKWFYAVPNVVVGMYSTRKSLVRQKTAAGKPQVHQQDYRGKAREAAPPIPVL